MQRRYLRFALLVSTTLAVSSVPGLVQAGTARGPLANVQWQLGPTSPFGGTRFDGEYVAQQNRIYFLGFRTFLDATDGSVWYLDVSTLNYVDTGVDMPLPISNYGIAALTDEQGRLGLYIFGGRTSTGGITKAVQVYYPATNTAQGIASDPWPGTTPSGCTSLPAMGVAVMNNRAIVMGGASFSTTVPPCVDDNSAETWIFNPLAPAGSRWTPGPPLNLARGYVTPAVLGGRVYAIGGDINAGGTLFPQKIVEAWQPPTGGWNDAAVADLPGIGCDESQAFGMLAPITGIVLAGCGQWPNAIPNTGFYDPATNSWSGAGQFHDNRRNHAGALVPVGTSVRMYILGGYGEPSFVDPIQSSEAGKLTAGPAQTSTSGSSLTGGHPTTN